ncbi:hypothetical protein SAMN05661008_01757 [Alkalithermobacter thermoalcaliphilus JW-YL-7 = DSM 7308]|uniref:Uncharacterized protein n=1 Tax=Alkalithermobacter thermoalcaliphilus JW-YL-7 = DSM 7308 TaxID=1121328 RepID=A0A150FPP4_CLOPD|nr:hypothetical protein JWYL7_0603 [[Clostridium] paradoxum JW-YL-7 = DSM 7308]SHL25467.1 hypothetical protein SAMN05661008_01757 [[Clostridium] paradoxum JW-YL-7 = DSM 7308]
MISGLIDLMYKEVIKTRLNQMEKVDPCSVKVKHNTKIVNKIDNVTIKFIKLGLCLLFFSIIFRGNIYLSTISFLIYLIYRKMYKRKINSYLNLTKTKVQVKTKPVFTESIKNKIKGMFIILILLTFSQYKGFYVAILMIVFMFTILDIYSNIKSENKMIIKGEKNELFDN